MSHRGHSPVRTCVGCGGRDAQVALIRFQCEAGGALRLAPESERIGRSAYLHRDEACWRRFATRRGPVRSLGRNLDRTTRSAFVEGLAAIGDRPGCEGN